MYKKTSGKIPYRMALIEICNDLGIPLPEEKSSDIVSWTVEKQANYLMAYNDRYLKSNPGRHCSGEVIAQILRALGMRPVEIYAIGRISYIGAAYRPAGEKLAYFVQAEGSSASNAAANLLRRIYGYGEIDPRTGQNKRVLEPMDWEHLG